MTLHLYVLHFYGLIVIDEYVECEFTNSLRLSTYLMERSQCGTCFVVCLILPSGFEEQLDPSHNQVMYCVGTLILGLDEFDNYDPSYTQHYYVRLCAKTYSYRNLLDMTNHKND